MNFCTCGVIFCCGSKAKPLVMATQSRDFNFVANFYKSGHTCICDIIYSPTQFSISVTI